MLKPHDLLKKISVCNGESTAKAFSSLYFVGCLFAAAFLLRLGYLLFLRKYYPYFYHPSEDTLYYQQWAMKLAAGMDTGQDAFWGLPFYPYFLSFLYKLTGASMACVRVIHLLLGATNCVLVYHLARRGLSEGVARLAGILMAVNFLMIYYDWLMNSVTVSITLGLLCAIIFVGLVDEINPRRWLLAGIITGLLALIDGKAVFLVLFLCIYLLIKTSRRSQFRLFVFLIGFLIVVFSISLRNRIMSGSWVFISAQSGLSLFVGNNINASGIYSNPDFLEPDHAGQDRDQRIVAEAALGRPLRAGEVSHYWAGQALGFISENPLKAFKLLFHKVRLFFTDHPLADDIDLKMQRRWVKALDWNSFAVLCPFAVLGLCVYLRRGNKVVLISAIFIASQLLFTVIFFLSTKQRASVYPFFIIAESLALCWLWERFLRKDFRSLLLIGICLIFWTVVLSVPPVDDRSVALTRLWKDGVIYERRSDFKNAERCFLKAVELNPCSTSLGNLGSLYLQKDEPLKGIPYLQKAVALRPQYVAGHYNLGIAYELTGDTMRAEEQYRRVLQLMPDDLDSMARLGMVLDVQMRCSEAKDIFQRLIRMNPGSSAMIKAKFFSKCLQ